jgi:hypothetical protein
VAAVPLLWLGRGVGARGAVSGVCAGAALVPVEASAVVVMGRRTVAVALVDTDQVCRGCAQVTVERDKAGLPMHSVCARAIAETVERETVDYRRRWSR